MCERFAPEKFVPERFAPYRLLRVKFAPDNSILDRSKPSSLQCDQSIGPFTTRLSGTLSPSLSISGLQS